MKMIIISGPSGSGKTVLADNLTSEFDNLIVIRTDSFYRDNFIIKILSIFSDDIYDRMISIKFKELITTLNSILKNKSNVYSYTYNFKTKKSSRVKLKENQLKTSSLLVLEGIFSHRLINHFENNILMKILCVEGEKLCFERRLRRDIKYRGRKRFEVETRFKKSWDIYHMHATKFINDTDVITISSGNIKQYKNILETIRSEFHKKK